MHFTSPEKAQSILHDVVRRTALLASVGLLALLVGPRPAAAQPVTPDAPGAHGFRRKNREKNTFICA